MSDDPCPACGFDPTLSTVPVATVILHHSYPSQNQLGANGRGSQGWHYRRLRQELAGALHAALWARPIAKATGKRRLWLKRVYRKGKRPYDVANLYGGGKALIDVIVSRGLLIDDSPKWLEAFYHQEPGAADQIVLRFEDFSTL
jgi:hypothetical protein